MSFVDLTFIFNPFFPLLQAFMQELESDKEMRSKLNLYKVTDERALKRAAEAGGMEVEGGATAGGERWIALLCMLFAFGRVWWV